MKSRDDIAAAAHRLAQPIAQAQQVALWEVEFVQEGGLDILRFVLDGLPGQAVDLDRCEAFSRAVEAELDRADPIEQSYCLEVSSAGLTRRLSRPEHFEAHLGDRLDIQLAGRLGEAGAESFARLQFDVCDAQLPVDVTRFEATLRGREPQGALRLEDDLGRAFTLPADRVQRVSLALCWPPKGNGRRKREKK
ncbi:MAG: hypothetical protein GXX99_04655 [Clostridiales bacterium]|nr:hypothetical protein [Clostridiales bacterium]